MAAESAIYVKDACKSYGSKEVLKNLCMQVQRGTIYGLLGASGCGKTTLLSCVVGRRKLNSGEICVLGGHPGTAESGVPGPRVGYMPQEIALVGEFTVKDAIYYFGRIFNMSEKAITERFYKLTHLLDLPPENRYLKNCSGGQQRRVSFAAAMVHLPELLILDEPTVGVDPVLRDRIWNYLVEITQTRQTTVVITTHYIEEARQSNAIGLMRDGLLLAQASPATLLATFQTDYLEDVFLILSRRQQEGRLENLAWENPTENVRVTNSSSDVSLASFVGDHGSTDRIAEGKHQPTGAKKSPEARRMLNGRRIKALLDKNWKQFYRNTAGIVFLMLIPVIEVLLFMIAVGGDPKGISLGIVNSETMSVACPNFTSNGSAVPYSFSSCHYKELSCRFLQQIDHPMITKVPFDTLEQAMDAARSGETIGALYMAENFTESFEKRMDDGRNVEDKVLDFSQIKVWLDQSNRQLGATLKYKLLSLYEDFAKEVMKDCNLSPRLIEFFDIEYFFGSQDDTFTVYMVPGVVLTIMFFIATIMTSQIIIAERCEGVWERSTIAGVTSIEITLTHFLLQSCIVVVHTIESLGLPFLLFNTQNVGSMWTLALLTFLQGIAGISFGFWVSVVSYNYSMANIVATGSFYFMIFICGLMWPLEGQPIYLRWVANCLPFTIPIESFRNVMKKGWTIGHSQILTGFGMEIIWIVGLAVLSVMIMKSKR